MTMRLFLIFVTFHAFFAHASAKQERNLKYTYSYQDRSHSMKENLTHIGLIYAASWPLYYLTQPTTFRENGSFTKFKENFGKIVYDDDEPFWNWIVHPYSGSQLYLYYRSQGYDRVSAFQMGAISSALFEFAVEIYTEPASVQDLVLTPVLGSTIGLGLEKLTLYLLNTGHPVSRFFGHLFNPFTLFPGYQGRVQMRPHLSWRQGKLQQAGASWSLSY